MACLRPAHSLMALRATLALSLLATVAAHAATLPPHRMLRVLIVSDFVNPHSLPPADLVEPGDLSFALRDPGTGLNLDPALDGVREIPTNSIEQATAALSVPMNDPARYDVLIYFAHRIPDNGNNAQARQDAFTAAASTFVANGGGLVVYHHGAYFASGKEGIVDLVGGTASGAVPWNVVEGQNVINVSTAHFVSTNGLVYPNTVSYADAARGIPAGVYPAFNNLPDERYPSYDINPGAGTVEILFASDYNENGATHLLGFTHHRAGWCGRVVAYQPGEYQPNMLDVNGRNFQIIANEIVWAARAEVTNPVPVTLHAVRGSSPGSAELSWTGGAPCWSIWRADSPIGVEAPGNLLTLSAATSLSDPAPAAPLFHYSVTSP